MSAQIMAFWSQVRSARRYKWFTMGLVWLLCLSGWALVSQMPDQFRSQVEVKIDSAAVVAPLLAKRKIVVDAETRADLVIELLLSDAHIQKIAELAGALPKSGESKESVVEELSAALNLEAKQEGVYVLSAIQNDPQSSQQLLKAALTELSGAAKTIAEADTAAELQSLERKAHDVEAKLHESEAARSLPNAIPGAKPESASGSVDQAYQALRTELDSLSKRRDEVMAGREQFARAHPEIFRVLSDPNVPEIPSGPNRVTLYGIILFSALAIGALLAVGVNFFRPTLNSVQRLREVTGLPVLGYVGLNQGPIFKQEHTRSRIAFTTALVSLAMFFLGLILLESKGVNLYHLSK